MTLTTNAFAATGTTFVTLLCGRRTRACRPIATVYLEGTSIYFLQTRGEPARRGMRASGEPGFTPEGFIDVDSLTSRYRLPCTSACGASYTLRRETLRELCRQGSDEVWLT